MNYSPILILHGEPNSIFLEIFFKVLKLKNIKSPLILISSLKILKKQMKILKFRKKIRILNNENCEFEKLDNKFINLININFNQKKAFEKISKKSNIFLEKSFQKAFEILKKKRVYKFINGPISKKNFLKNRYLGITEYISEKFRSKHSCMLIYNKSLSVCPITTHLPLKRVAKTINEETITKKIELIHNFYKKKIGYIPKIGILALNPHCESTDKFNEDDKIIKPLIKKLKKKYNVNGPFSADTIFTKQNRKKFNVIIGMYHDQVLTPIKTIFEYDAINITLGLPFIRISPDHGPNENMVGKNLSDPTSLFQALNFLEKY
tara:strand:- start:660 stop:1622 length:963 start_codon:yes stop_codon:yes gene_type:complete